MRGCCLRRTVRSKDYSTIGACGIDCGLCPMHHVKSGSGCGGCTAPGPAGTAGRWCAIARCAIREHGFETCADCDEFPCERLDGWDEADSVVTHKTSLANLRAIRERGIEQFLAQQGERVALLNSMLSAFDDGRSKGFFCLACTLLPVEGLRSALDSAVAGATPMTQESDARSRAIALRERLSDSAGKLGIELKLRRQSR